MIFAAWFRLAAIDVDTNATPLAGVVPALLHYEPSKCRAEAMEPLGQARVAFDLSRLQSAIRRATPEGRG